MKNSLSELLSTLEEIRAAKFPDIPPEIISEIIQVQMNNQDNPGNRQNETQKIVMKYANQITSEEGEEL